MPGQRLRITEDLEIQHEGTTSAKTRRNSITGARAAVDVAPPARREKTNT